MDTTFCKSPIATFSISGWAKSNSWALVPGGGVIIGKSDGGSGLAYQWQISHGFDGKIAAFVSSNVGGTDLIEVKSAVISTNQWFHFVLSFDGNLPKNQRLSLFVNNVAGTISRNLGNLGTTLTNTNQQITIGACHQLNNVSAIDNPYNGVIDDIKIFNKALTITDAVNLYSEGPFLDAGLDQTICNGDSVKLLATGAISYVWSPSSTLSNSNISNPFAKPSDTTVYYVVGTLNGCSATDYVRVNVRNKKANAGPDISSCKKDFIQLNATGTGSFFWSPIKFINNINIYNPIVNPDTNIVYNLLVSDGVCKSYDTINISVTSVDAEIFNKDTTVCPTDSVAFRSLINGTSFKWNPTKYLFDTLSITPYSKPDSTIKYYLTVTKGSCIVKDSLLITVASNIIISAGADQKICAGDSTQLSATGAPLYLWSPSLGLSNSNIPNPKASPNITTTYIVKGESGNCKGYDTVELVVNSKPTVNLGLDTVKCANDELSFSPTVSGANVFAWSPALKVDNSSIPNATTSIKTPQLFVLTVKDSITNCINRDTIFVDVPPLNASFLLSDSTSKQPPLTTTITNKSSPLPLAYTWVIKDTGIVNSTDTNLVHTFNAAGRYSIFLTVKDQRGCEDTLTKFVAIFDKVNIFVPNAFTPNGDGLNDLFEIRGNKGSIISVTGNIWDRWGGLVYSFAMPGGQWWDGKINGEPIAEGVYIYDVTILDSQNEIQKRKGSLYVFR